MAFEQPQFEKNRFYFDWIDKQMASLSGAETSNNIMKLLLKVHWAAPEMIQLAAAATSCACT